MRQPAILALALGGMALFAYPHATAKPVDTGKKKAPTYADVAPILNKQCVECHRPGEVAPFSLVGYENAKKRASTVAASVQDHIMPPWKSVDPEGTFKDERKLTKDQIQMLQDWADAGAPQGDASKSPKPPKFASDWPLGKPDSVITPEKPFELGAEGSDVYRHFVVKTNEKEDRWVNAIDVKPGNNKVVHHVIIYIDGQQQGRKLEAANTDGQPGYNSYGGPGFVPQGSLGGWAPGLRARFSPPNTAIRVPAGSDLVVEVHYHKSGKAELDQTKVGLYFAKQPPKKEIALVWAFKFSIDIPADKANHVERKSTTVKDDMTLYGLMPHMHLLGKKMVATAKLPDGTVKQLIKVDDWDFNWQMSYAYQEPVKLPKGTKVTIEATYDNSTSNPRNPNNPPKRVQWGEQTTDEMFLLIGYVTLDHLDGPIGLKTLWGI